MAGEKKDRFGVFVEEAAKFCSSVGLRENLPIEIYQEPSDWAFTIKMDALLETACRETVGGILKLVVGKSVKPRESLTDFITSLSINGRTSLRTLLKAAECPDECLALIEAVRKVRNAYAHNIRMIDESLLAVVKAYPDRKSILREFSAIDPKNFDEAEYLKMVESDAGFLRFGILDGTLRFLILSYHNVLKGQQVEASR